MTITVSKVSEWRENLEQYSYPHNPTRPRPIWVFILRIEKYIYLGKEEMYAVIQSYATIYYYIHLLLNRERETKKEQPSLETR